MRSWRHDEQPHSAVLIPVSDAESAIGPWRRRYDPTAVAGVPPHVTLIVPWLVPDDIDDTALTRLGAVVAQTARFAFSLAGIGWFSRRVVWLAPRPAEPFLDLIGAIAGEFETPPWGGEFDLVVPHLTVAHGDDESKLTVVAENLGNDLPIACQATEAWVMIGDGVRWWRRAALPLG